MVIIALVAASSACWRVGPKNSDLLTLNLEFHWRRSQLHELLLSCLLHGQMSSALAPAFYVPNDESCLTLRGRF